MVGPSCDRIAEEERCFHRVITNVLFSSEGRNEGRFERCQQVCVQTNQVDDEFEGTGSSFGQEMCKKQQTTISQTHRVEWRIDQNGFDVCTRACEHSTSRTSTANVGWSCSLEVHHRANRSSTSKMSQPRNGRMNLTITQVHSFQEILCTQERWKRFDG